MRDVSMFFQVEKGDLYLQFTVFTVASVSALTSSCSAVDPDNTNLAVISGSNF